MAKKKQEPQYVMSALNTPMLNYKVYIMSGREKITINLIVFLVGGIVGLTFYGGQFRDVDGIATTATTISNFVVFLLTGILTNRIYLPIYRQNLCEKRRLHLTLQFRSFLEALAVSLSSGMNMTESMISAYNDLKVEYSEDAYIVTEVKEILKGMQNNIPIEKMLASFGERSQIDDIKNFGIVFDICYRAGGNMKDIVRRTSNIISEKIEINEEIQTSLASNKTQFNAMMCIPIVMMILLRMMSNQFSASFATIPGIISITMAIGIFGISYKLGLKIMNVKG